MLCKLIVLHNVFYSPQATSHTIPLPTGEGLGVGLYGGGARGGAFWRF